MSDERKKLIDDTIQSLSRKGYRVNRVVVCEDYFTVNVFGRQTLVYPFEVPEAMNV